MLYIHYLSYFCSRNTKFYLSSYITATETETYLPVSSTTMSNQNPFSSLYRSNVQANIHEIPVINLTHAFHAKNKKSTACDIQCLLYHWKQVLNSAFTCLPVATWWSSSKEVMGLLCQITCLSVQSHPLHIFSCSFSIPHL